eukprot:TRINITY_DN9662_c0_g1_i29.p3 TRINITY_DN9662_c0_g1~~TRINITY_DN9662_c0_g1_i29.p3  ORF type:complete len:119 (-),score=22.84 TRINITY_DN9662_c0_g1_i29:64-420(-)
MCIRDRGTVYAGEEFTLQFRYTDKYPFESPEVMFINKPPIHPHVYSNGFICLSILDSDWTPSMTTAKVCLSILSMLSSCKKKEPPANDKSSMAYFKGKSPKQVTWLSLIHISEPTRPY